MSEIRSTPPDVFYEKIRDILESARTGVVRTVNTAQVLSNWLIGREIIEAEQQGQHRADYGENLLKNLAQKLKQDFGKGYSYSNLKYMRQFYLAFPHLLTAGEIGHAVSDQSSTAELSRPNPDWQPGRLHPHLSWTHYRTLVKVENLDARAFYVNYYDRERCTEGDNPTLGLILCSDKNDAVVKYTLGAEQQEKIFASRYQLHLPTEAELRRELVRVASPLENQLQLNLNRD